MVIDASAIISVIKVQEGLGEITADDAVASEEPLEIRLLYGPENNRQIQNVAVTMRTPGHDAELATGFLFTEGIIKSADDIAEAGHSFIACAENRENTIQVNLQEGVTPNLRNADRNFYTTSSCGVCGKSSINAIRTVSSFNEPVNEDIKVKSEMLHELPDLLRQHQQVFESTGGLHASALFDLQGELLAVREDVGRHNALDKLIGASLNNGWLPLHDKVLLLSGRISFELVQKAAMAGIKVVAAIGAPSSLAIQLAEEFNITLVGFLRRQHFNIYNAAHRISIT